MSQLCAQVARKANSIMVWMKNHRGQQDQEEMAHLYSAQVRLHLKYLMILKVCSDQNGSDSVLCEHHSICTTWAGEGKQPGTSGAQ